jgi:16S rRNA (guanine966-N2)-methyltransferase
VKGGAHRPRIIAGAARGRRLAVPHGDVVRPTKDRVKAAVFSALDARGLLTDAVVVDLYAGCGALGLEALSRGAAHCTFVERDRGALACLRTNVDLIAPPGCARVLAADVQAWVRTAPSADLVFADPPYDQADEETTALLAALVARAPGATVVLERATIRGTPALPVGSSVVWERAMGDTLVLFIEPVAPAAGAP